MNISHNPTSRKLFVSAVLLFCSYPSSLRAGSDEHLPAIASGEIPFRLFRDYEIVVEGSIGNRQNLHFLVDTGSTVSVVDRKLAEQLNLPSKRAGEVINFGKALPRDIAMIPNIQFGPAHAEQAWVMMSDLSYIKSTHIDAVIGLDMLQQSSFTIDYKNKKLRFGPIEPQGKSVPMALNPTCLSVELSVGGKPVHLIVDTGVNGIALYSDRADKIPHLTPNPEKDLRQSIGGSTNVTFATFITGFRLGDKTNLGEKALVVPSTPDSHDPNLDGVFGVSLLNAKRVGFDFNAKTLYWE